MRWVIDPVGIDGSRKYWSDFPNFLRTARRASWKVLVAVAAPICGTTLFVVLAGCSNSPGGSASSGTQQTAQTAESAAPAARAPPILLFTGTGTSPGDVAAIETVLNQNDLGYARVTSAQMDAMNQSQIQAYRLLIVPGGNFVEMGNALSAGATANVQRAVKAGLNYLGICAGGFLAGSIPAPYKSFGLTSGVHFGFYSAERKGIRKAVVRITPAEGSALDLYWEDGPDLSGWGDAIATYPDGEAAVVEGLSGEGWVVLAGIHPEAPETWRRGMAFTTPVGASNAYALALIDAALNRKRLPHF